MDTSLQLNKNRAEGCAKLEAETFEEKLMLAIRTVRAFTRNRLAAIGTPNVR